MDDWMRAQVRLECLKIVSASLPGLVMPAVKEAADELFSWVVRQPPGKPVMAGGTGGALGPGKTYPEGAEVTRPLDLAHPLGDAEPVAEAKLMLEQAAKSAHQQIDDAVGGFYARTRNL